MNIHLNNWLDKVEGKEVGITNNAIIKEMARQGGLASVKSRFKGKSKKEISEIMRNIRYSKEDHKLCDDMDKSALNALKGADFNRE